MATIRTMPEARRSTELIRRIERDVDAPPYEQAIKRDQQQHPYISQLFSYYRK